MPKWVRDYLLLPLVVGLVVAAFTFGLPKLFADKLELSYEIDGPTAVLDDPAIQQVQIEVNGITVSDLIAFRVRLWNSGDRAIKNLPVRVVFDAQAPDFSILNATHQTTPAFEFGRIDELEATPKSRRYKYELVNPGDEDVITFLANGSATLDLYAKGEGLTVNRRERTTEARPFGDLTVVFAWVVATVASFLAFFLRAAQYRMSGWVARLFLGARR